MIILIISNKHLQYDKVTINLGKLFTKFEFGESNRVIRMKEM